MGIISLALFLFMMYGLHTGVGMIDDFPKLEKYKIKAPFTKHGNTPAIQVPDVGDGIEGIFVSILLWIVVTIALAFLLLVFEAVLWLSIFIILATLYWVFFRALKNVFNKSGDTKGDLGLSATYALKYTFLYVGWIFGLVYLTQVIS